MQQWLGIGRLTKDVDARSGGETMMALFTLAVDGDKKDQVDFINITAFGKTADLCSQYLAKGRMVAVSGKWHSRTVDKNGNKQTYWSVTADKVKFLDKGGQSNGTSNQQPNRRNNMDPFSDDETLDIDEDKLPF